MLYEMLITEAESQNVEVCEEHMGPRIRGLYGDNVIWLNQGLPTHAAKVCVLAEEMGHHYTSTGNILNQKKLAHIKQEKRARNWAYKKLIPLESFVNAFKEGITNRYEFAEFLGVTEYFLEQAIEHYKEKYGLCVEWTSYVIYFEPLGVLEIYEDY
ncbi:ImmA/IrrE family metallo-endopeptidase [Desulfosporosinus hippei]|uniref:IrrE N-terminal-like domain-containing protein n=1 Tax=Desulfosporosinus hippei DSM 8344 TaxID=1121419 RepID=A0A1G7UMT4_9FIRM|nr:ImmA/IrrE family metallo-endopeptidase [Desulfosporosinus hippei]SDG48787.1 hypothetical protein SAMN05443529_103191 [Desulfosporosinus hippei DSM 8344]